MEGFYLLDIKYIMMIMIVGFMVFGIYIVMGLFIGDDVIWYIEKFGYISLEEI